MFRQSTFHFSPRLSSPRVRLLFVILAVFILAAIFSGPAFAQENWTASYWNNRDLVGAPVYQRAEYALSLIHI